jgi:very-short-patch-repair endonuclease
MPLDRQRMGFLLLLPGHRRVVIEFDGIQHYADDSQRPDMPYLRAKLADAAS